MNGKRDTGDERKTMLEMVRENEEIRKKLSSELNIHPIFAQMLVNRGISEAKEAFKFMNPQLKNLYDPFLMKGMKEGVERIKEAIKKKEIICIYGDYDVDGISATALLVLTLKKLSAKVIPYIPHRLKEGYGLSVHSIKKLKEEGAGLLVTVDCGITSLEEVGFARALGMDVIVTDHHEPLAISPPACAIINPKQIGCQYPFKELAGVGVSFKLCQALNNLEDGELKVDNHLDLVALGTIADLVPLQDENRILVRYGLEDFSRTNKIGLKALGEVSGINLEDIDTSHIGYRLAPRINACGRMGDARRGLNLLLTENFQEARFLALLLEEDNRLRQKIQEEVFEEAIKLAQAVDLRERGILVLCSKNWHRGVIGIVASRLVEEYCCPVILIAVENGTGYGSARSIEGVNIIEILNENSDLFSSYGGHKYAAGFTIEEGKIEELKKRVAASGLAGEEWLPRGILIEAEVDPTEISSDIFRDCLDIFSPFGHENPYPSFLARNMKITELPRVTGNGNLLLTLRGKKGTAVAVGFKKGVLAEELREGDCLDIVFSPRLDRNNELYLRIEEIYQ